MVELGEFRKCGVGVAGKDGRIQHRSVSALEFTHFLSGEVRLTPDK